MHELIVAPIRCCSLFLLSPKCPQPPQPFSREFEGALQAQYEQYEFDDVLEAFGRLSF